MLHPSPPIYNDLRRATTQYQPRPVAQRTSSLAAMSPMTPPHNSRSHSPSSVIYVHSPPPPQPRAFEIFYVHGPSEPRRAPLPPRYRHRRKRSRHIKFKDPAHSGLFTLTEVREEEEEEGVETQEDEYDDEESEIERTPSAAPSSACFPFPSPKLELSSLTVSRAMLLGSGSEVEEMEEIALDEVITHTEVAQALETPAKQANKDWKLDIPDMADLSPEDASQFSPPFMFDDAPEVEDIAGLLPNRSAPQAKTKASEKAKSSRRPPPLDFSSFSKRRPISCYRSHPFAACKPRPRQSYEPPAHDRASFDSSRPLSEPSSLLSPLPILSPGVFRARQRSVSTPAPGNSEDVSETASSSDLEAFKDLSLRYANSPEDDSRRGSGSPSTASQGSEVDLEMVLQDLLTSCGEIPAHFASHWESAFDIPSPSPSVTQSEANSSSLSRPSSSGSTSSSASYSSQVASFPLPPSRTLLGSPIRLASALSPDPDLRTPTTPPNLLLDDMDGLDDPFSASISISISPTPSSASSSSAASGPRPQRKRQYQRPISKRSSDEDSWRPQPKGDHSFLQSLTRGEDMGSVSSASSGPSILTLSTRSTGILGIPSSPSNSFRSTTSSSSSSSKRLPKRKGLPDLWRQ